MNVPLRGIPPGGPNTARRLRHLLLGWIFMAGGAALMLEAALPWAGWPRSDRFLAAQGTIGFVLLAAGCFLRRLALRSRDP